MPGENVIRYQPPGYGEATSTKHQMNFRGWGPRGACTIKHRFLYNLEYNANPRDTRVIDSRINDGAGGVPG